MKRKDELIETAFLLFLKKGFDRVSLNEIIKSAGITTGGFYYYFDSKESLIIEVIDRYIFFYFNTPVQTMKNSKESSKNKIKTYLSKSIGYDINKKKFTNRTESGKKIDYKELYILYIGSLQKYDILKKKYSEAILYITNSIKELLDEGISSGEFRKNFDSYEFASLILAIFSGTISSWMVMENIDLYDTFSDHIDQIWINIEK